MASLVSRRYRIAHSYGDLDPVRIPAEVPTGLAHVEGMLRELSSVLAGA
jgi:hypothetical protein